MRVWFVAAVSLIVVFSFAACDKGITDPSQNKTDVFSDTLPKGAGKVHFFSVSRNGEYTVTFDSINPALTVGGVVQIQVNALVNGACTLGLQIVDVNTNATPGRQALPRLGSALITPGQYCVTIADEGFLTADSVYQITVSHP